MPDRQRITPDEIREIRHSLGMTQPEFAKEVGVNKSTVSFWEMPDRESPSARSPGVAMTRFLLGLKG